MSKPQKPKKPKKPEKVPRGCVDCQVRSDVRHAWCHEVCKFVARKESVCDKFVWRR